MEHTKFIEQISLWLDDELPVSEIDELHTHLRTCSACTQTYREMKQADLFLRQAATVFIEPAVGFVSRFEARLAAHRPRKAWYSWLAYLGLFLGSFSILTVSLLIGGLALLTLWATVIDGQFTYYWLGVIGGFVNQARVILGLGNILLGAAVDFLRLPIVWLSLPTTIGLGWLWTKLMRSQQSQLRTTSFSF